MTLDTERMDAATPDPSHRGSKIHESPAPATHTGGLPRLKVRAPSRLAWRWIRYLVVGGIVNGLVWGSTLVFLKTTRPTYTSSVLLNLPGSVVGVNVNLPEIGQAISSSGSPFGSTTYDPRENFKLILMGDKVKTATAKALSLQPKQVGEPRIKIIDNTTAILLELSGNTPQEAQHKLEVLVDRFNARLEELRLAETSARQRVTLQSLEQAEKRLALAQRKLSAYKTQSGLNSPDQIKNLVSSIELLRQKNAEVSAQAQQSQSEGAQLSTNLDLSSREAADALLLQTDPLFQKSLRDYSDATVALAALLPSRGSNYPDVVKERDKQQSALNIMAQRGEVLLGQALSPSMIERLNLDTVAGSIAPRASLFQSLVSMQAEQQGLSTQARALAEQITLLESRLSGLVEKESTFDSLTRDLQIAEAVFASTLAKADLGRGDGFNSYPLVQAIEPPSLPNSPSAPKKTLILAGTLLGSVLISFGLTLLWWRRPLLRLSLKLLRGILN